MKKRNLFILIVLFICSVVALLIPSKKVDASSELVSQLDTYGVFEVGDILYWDDLPVSTMEPYAQYVFFNCLHGYSFHCYYSTTLDKIVMFVPIHCPYDCGECVEEIDNTSWRVIESFAYTTVNIVEQPDFDFSDLLFVKSGNAFQDFYDNWLNACLAEVEYYSYEYPDIPNILEVYPDLDYSFNPDYDEDYYNGLAISIKDYYSTCINNLGFESGSMAGSDQSLDATYFTLFNNYYDSYGEDIFNAWDELLSFDDFCNLDFDEKVSYLESAIFYLDLYSYNYGINIGYDKGNDDGFQSGLESGYTQGKEEGYEQGYDVGSMESLMNFFHKYDDELLGCFKDCYVYVRNSNFINERTSSVKFSDYAYLIYHDGIFDFKMLFDILIKDSIYFKNLDPIDRFDFVFDFPFDSFKVKDLSTFIGGFNHVSILGDEIPDLNVSRTVDSTLPIYDSIGVGYYDFYIHTLSLTTGDYSTLDGFGSDDVDLFFSTNSSEYYYLGYEKGNYDGYITGKEDGYDSGLDEGEKLGYNLGYSDGYMENNFSLQSLFWTIAGLPFESVKSIWDVEFLGVNLTKFMTGLLMFGVVIFVIKKVIK